MMFASATAFTGLLGAGLLGALGGLMQASQNKARTQKAEAAIAPVRAALAGYDVDALAQSTARDSLAGIDWLRERPTTFGKDETPAGMSGVLDKSPADETVFVRYSYDLSPDFGSLRLIEIIQIADKNPVSAGTDKALKPTDRLSGKHLVYSRSVVSIVQLPNAVKADLAANANSWASNGGWIVRGALRKAFASVGQLTPRTLALTQADVSAMNHSAGQRRMAGEFTGRQISEENGTRLIWANQFIAVQPAW